MKTKINYQPEVLIITSYPPRECGIATYSHDLITALNKKFYSSFSIRVCALEASDNDFAYPEEVKYTLKTAISSGYHELASIINQDASIKLVVVQHEFGLFSPQADAFVHMISVVEKPVIVVFHSVLPHPDEVFCSYVKKIIAACDYIVVMTNNAASILMEDYEMPNRKIEVIAHGTHLVPHINKDFLKNKYGFAGRTILSNFGLLSEGKSIETAIDAMSLVIEKNPEALFLVIGRTHPEVIKEEGEKYRDMLKEKVLAHNLQKHVEFINEYLPLPDLLEYLQLTDIYLFTSSNPNQAVSGTFVYAMSCACAIVSTPIPHSRELISKEAGIIFEYGDSIQLANVVSELLNNEQLRNEYSKNSLQLIVSTAWENSAIAHALLFKKTIISKISIKYRIPEINLTHIKNLTTPHGLIQYSKINQPDIESGFALDESALALVAMCMHYKLTNEESDLDYIHIYLDYIRNCQQENGDFINILNISNNRRLPVDNMNSQDGTNTLILYALAFLVSTGSILPAEIISEGEVILQKVLPRIRHIHSARAIAFAIKGLYYCCLTGKSSLSNLLETLADQLAQLYLQNSTPKWHWFESNLSCAYSILPEAMLYSWLITRKDRYKEIAITSLDFLLHISSNRFGIGINLNSKWQPDGNTDSRFGEHPFDLAFMVITLGKFYDIFKVYDYRVKMENAFNWFLGNNRLHQIVYNPCTGGCYDRLEEANVNLNQGANSTFSYLLARLTIDKYKYQQGKPDLSVQCLLQAASEQKYQGDPV